MKRLISVLKIILIVVCACDSVAQAVDLLDATKPADTILVSEMPGVNRETRTTVNEIITELEDQEISGRLTLDVSSETALLVEDDGVNDNVLVVDTTLPGVGVNKAPTTGLDISGNAAISGTLSIGAQTITGNVDASGTVDAAGGFYIDGFALDADDVGAQPAFTPGDLTEATSNVLSISGGSGALVSGASIRVLEASAGQSGYLSSGDWSIFNGKQSALSNGIGELTTAEVNQLKNIDSSTISQTQWGYLGGTDQNIASSSTVQFATITIDKTDAPVLTLNDSGDSSSVVLTADSIGNTIEADIIGELTLFTAGNANQLHLNNDGNVGIGISTPTQALEVDGTIEANNLTINTIEVPTRADPAFIADMTITTADSPSLTLTDSTDSTTIEILSDTAANTIIGDSATNMTIAVGANANQLELATDGRVGIGVAVPTQALDVLGTVESDGFTINGTPVGTSSSSYWNLLGSDINFVSGNVSVGTTAATEALNVDGNILQTTGDYIATDLIQAIDGNGLGLQDDGGNGIFIDDGGNVIIGSGTPNDLLEVRGPITTPGSLTLSTAETTIVDGDELGKIDFQAPLEADGTDAVLVGASIVAEANDTFAADNNTTDLVFMTGASEAATEKMRLTSDGTLNLVRATGATVNMNRDDGTITDGEDLAVFEFSGDGGTGGANAATIVGEAEGTWAASGDNGARLLFRTTADGSDVLTSRMVIDGDGNVGIGESDPDVSLHISDPTDPAFVLYRDSATITDGQSLGGIYFGGNDDADKNASAYVRGRAEGAWSVTNEGSEIVFYTTDENATSADQKMVIDDEGNVGIGLDAPVSLLHIKNSSGEGIRLTNAASGDTANDGFSIYHSAATAIIHQEETEDLVIQNASTDDFVMKSDGKIGIGTDAPNSELEIVGFLQIDTVSGAPTATDCDSNDERGRMIIDTTGGSEKLYICPGVAGWHSISVD